MAAVGFSGHARDMLQERNIAVQWVLQAMESPDRTEVATEGNTHYIRAIPEHGGRFLRVVVDTRTTPKRVVTVFFDRRLGRKA